MLGWLRRKYEELVRSHRARLSDNPQPTFGFIVGTLADLADKQDLNWPPRPNGLLYQAIMHVYTDSKYAFIASRFPFPILPVEDQDGTFLGFIYDPQVDLTSVRWMLAADWLTQTDVQVITKGN